MITITVYTVSNPALVLALGMLVGLAVVRLTRWFLDILP